MAEMKVGSKSAPGALAGAIAGLARKDEDIILMAIGAGAVNQAIKAVAIARGYLAPSGIDVYVVPSFCDNVEEDGATKTAIHMSIKKEVR